MTASPPIARDRRSAPGPPGRSPWGSRCSPSVDLALALFMAVSPHAFYTRDRPLRRLQRPLLRDVATFDAALGRRPR